MNTTIITTFDPSSIPTWARRLPAVVAKCKTDLAFRCDVCAATTPAMKKLLERTAKS